MSASPCWSPVSNDEYNHNEYNHAEYSDAIQMMKSRVSIMALLVVVALSIVQQPVNGAGTTTKTTTKKVAKLPDSKIAPRLNTACAEITARTSAAVSLLATDPNAALYSMRATYQNYVSALAAIRPAKSATATALKNATDAILADAADVLAAEQFTKPLQPSALRDALLSASTRSGYRRVAFAREFTNRKLPACPGATAFITDASRSFDAKVTVTSVGARTATTVGSTRPAFVEPTGVFEPALLPASFGSYSLSDVSSDVQDRASADLQPLLGVFFNAIVVRKISGPSTNADSLLVGVRFMPNSGTYPKVWFDGLVKSTTKESPTSIGPFLASFANVDRTDSATLFRSDVLYILTMSPSPGQRDVRTLAKAWVDAVS